MTRILITGCNSCTGRHLVELLNRDPKCIVYGLDLGADSSLALTYEQCDIRDAVRMDEVIKRMCPSEVYHLAATTDERDAGNLVRANIEGTLNLLTACVQLADLPRVLLVGSCAVYPDLAETEDSVDEDRRLEPATVYAASRAAQSHLGQVFWRKHQLPVYLTRTFNLTGPGLAAHLSPVALARRLLAAREEGGTSFPLQNGGVVRDLVDVRDAVKAYRAILEKGAPGAPYNIGTGRGTTIQTMTEILAELIDFSVKISGDGSAESTSRSVITRSIANIDKVSRDTGWLPQIEIRQSLADMIAEIRTG